MSRHIAVIDIGTNTCVALACAVADDGTARVILDRTRITGLGRGAGSDGTLAETSISNTLDGLGAALEDCACASVSPKDILVTGTAALRRAPNRDAFLLQAKTTHQVDVEIIDGLTEARCSALAVMITLPNARHARLIDIGGGSTEVVDISAGVITSSQSVPIGSVRLTEEYLDGDPPSLTQREAAAATIAQRFAEFPPLAPGQKMIGVGGTATTALALALEMTTYDPSVVHGTLLPTQRLTEIWGTVTPLSIQERTALPGLSAKRAPVIGGGLTILNGAAVAFGANEIVISDSGLRHGVAAERFQIQTYSLLFPVTAPQS